MTLYMLARTAAPPKRAPTAMAAVGTAPAPEEVEVPVADSRAEVAEPNSEVRDSEAEPVADSRAEVMLEIWLLMLAAALVLEATALLALPTAEVTAALALSILLEASSMREETLLCWA
jgi:hypothetical protein